MDGGFHWEGGADVLLAFVVLAPDAAARVQRDPTEARAIKGAICKVNTQCPEYPLTWPWMLMYDATQYVEEHKAHYKKLAGGVEFVDAIPKNPSGKLLRRFLRDKAREIKAAQAAQRPTVKL